MLAQLAFQFGHPFRHNSVSLNPSEAGASSTAPDYFCDESQENTSMINKAGGVHLADVGGQDVTLIMQTTNHDRTMHNEPQKQYAYHLDSVRAVQSACNQPTILRRDYRMQNISNSKLMVFL